MKKTLLFGFMALFLPAICFAQSNYTESLTITTYYPAPYGVYRNLRLSPSQEPITGVAPGVMYFDNTTPKGSIKYRNKVGEWVNITEGGGASPGAPGDPLVNSAHTQSDCNNSGGSPQPSDVGLKLCQFTNAAGASCPPGWTQYKSWSTYSDTLCRCWTTSFGSDCGFCGNCTATGHPWSDSTTKVTCTYVPYFDSWGGRCWGTATCTPVISQVGCY